MRAVPIADLSLPPGLEFSHNGNLGNFTIKGDGETIHDRFVGVRAEGDNLQFFPERSAGQREILKMLGLS